MKKNSKIVISASRRTDIPAFYMDWFMAGIKQGYFSVENPYSRAVFRVTATPDKVHTIIFWSKNYSRFLEKDSGIILQDLGYHIFFHFTINSESRQLEPNILPLQSRLDQLARMTKNFNSQAITWRFDPICYFVDGNKKSNNLGDFEKIADAAADCGITRCVTSFVDIYKKIIKRCAVINDFSFVQLSLEKQAEILLRMADVLEKRNIKLYTCCEKKVFGHLPPDCAITPSACIDHGLLEKLYGKGLSKKKDKGQRASQGCGCMESKDVGSYSLHPCLHNCLFCYANPRPGI